MSTGIPACEDHACKNIPLVRTKLTWDGVKKQMERRDDCLAKGGDLDTDHAGHSDHM